MTTTIVSPYLDAPGALWLRGNLHMHTRRSDGGFEPQEAIDAYRGLGHDFLAFSDHDIPADYSGLDPRGMILLPCSEVSAAGSHVQAVGCTGRIEPESDRQKVIAAIRAAGGLAVLNHPNWEEDFNHYTFEELNALSGYAGIEILNGIIHDLPGNALATDKWDRLLAAGRTVWGLANDDSHAAKQIGRGWNVVRAAERSAGAILAALRAGSFYASSGVSIERLELDGSRLRLVAPDAQAIAVIGELGARIAWIEAAEMVFDAAGCKGPYFRVECFGRAGRMAWTQPFLVGGEEVERRRRLLAEHPVLRAGRSARAPRLTGKLSAAAWKQAGATESFIDSRTLGAPPGRTELAVLVAGGKILFGLRCEEPEPGRMKLGVTEHGRSTLWTDDGVELFLNVRGAGRRYFHVMANAAGFAYAIERNVPPGEAGRKLRVGARAGRWAGGWTLELAIPLADLGAKAARGERWGFNAVRNRHPQPGLYTLSFTGASNHTPERFGWLEF
jgi:hypothetical protein